MRAHIQFLLDMSSHALSQEILPIRSQLFKNIQLTQQESEYAYKIANYLRQLLPQQQTDIRVPA